jgi:hypothetical protein
VRAENVDLDVELLLRPVQIALPALDVGVDQRRLDAGPLEQPQQLALVVGRRGAPRPVGAQLMQLGPAGVTAGAPEDIVDLRERDELLV